MANLYLSNKLRKIILINKGINYYNSLNDEQWNEVKAILSKFGITVSDYEVIFDGKEYQIGVKKGELGEVSGCIFYEGTAIATGSIEGSNYCDREAVMKVFLDTLENLYKQKK